MNEAEQAPLEGEIVSQPPPVRLTKHPEETVKLIEAAFHNGFNIGEACQYAGISRTTFYEWMADDDVFSYRMSLAQGQLLKKAKQNVAAAIQDGDAKVSLKVLTLKDPDWKPKLGIEPPEEQQQTRDKIKGFLDDTNDGGYDASSTQPTAADEPGDIS